MAKQLAVIHPHGQVVTLGYEGDHPPLELLQALVGGYIELRQARWTTDQKIYQMYVNEEGKRFGCAPNPAASHLAEEFGYRGMPFCGVCVVDLGKEL